jgi:hypothetical protein
MKAAAFWWGHHLKIETWPLGEQTGWLIEVDIGERGENPQERAQARAIGHRGSSGTVITVSGLWQDAPVASKTRGAIASYLPSIYRKFLSASLNGHDRISPPDGAAPVGIAFEGRPLSFQPPKLLKAPYWPTAEGPKRGMKAVEWCRDVKVRLSSGKSISGWVGILDTMSRELSGFTLHYRGKGVGGVTPLDGRKEGSAGFRPRAIFGQAGSYRAQSYIGEFDVSALGKSITTDSTLWTPDEEEEFVERVLAILKDPKLDMWSMAVNYKRRKRSRVEKSNLTKASTTAVAELTSALSDVVSHHEHPGERDPKSPTNPEYSFVIRDREVHEHRFDLSFANDHAALFLSLNENRSRRHHRVIVNEGHRLFDDLPPIDVDMRTLLTRLSLALSAAEVFVDSPDRSLVRTKMNSILGLVHPKPDDLPDI